MVVFFWLGLWDIFFCLWWGFIGDLWISSPALYHCTMVTSGFHFWQFQVFNSGAEGSVVVLFWLHLWEIFILPAMQFELGISGLVVVWHTGNSGKIQAIAWFRYIGHSVLYNGYYGMSCVLYTPGGSRYRVFYLTSMESKCTFTGSCWPFLSIGDLIRSL